MPKNRTGHGSIYGSPYAKGEDISKEAVHRRYEREIARVTKKKNTKGFKKYIKKNGIPVSPSNYERLVVLLFKQQNIPARLIDFKYKDAHHVEVTAFDSRCNKHMRCKIDLKQNKIEVISMLD